MQSKRIPNWLTGGLLGLSIALIGSILIHIENNLWCGQSDICINPIAFIMAAPEAFLMMIFPSLLQADPSTFPYAVFFYDIDGYLLMYGPRLVLGFMLGVVRAIRHPKSNITL